MKVLQLGPYPPPHGGVQTHIVDLVNFLRGQGIECNVLNLTRFRKRSENGIYYPSSALEVLWHLLSRRYDIIHLHVGGRIWPQQLGLALVCCSLPGTRCVFTFHSGGSPSSPEGRSAHAHTLRGFVLRRFDHVIAVNDEIAEFFQRLGIEADHIQVISPFVAPGAVKEQDVLPSQVLAFIETHHPILISVGLLEPEYDLGLQMEALGRIRKSWPEAGLLIVGSGSLDETLRKQSSTLAYAADICLVGDLDHSATLGAIQQSDIMLRTTWYDGDALSVREALHLGVPVIASDNGMRPDGVHLVPSRSLDALVEAVSRVLTGSRTPKVVLPAKSELNLENVLKIYNKIHSSQL